MFELVLVQIQDYFLLLNVDIAAGADPRETLLSTFEKVLRCPTVTPADVALLGASPRSCPRCHSAYYRTSAGDAGKTPVWYAAAVRVLCAPVVR
jgi:hypothetical protein